LRICNSKQSINRLLVGYVTSGLERFISTNCEGRMVIDDFDGMSDDEIWNLLTELPELNKCRAFNELGHRARHRRDFERTISMYGQSASIAKEIEDHYLAGFAQSCQGSAYTAMNNYTDALEAYKGAVSEYELYGNQNDLADVLGSLAHTYNSLERYGEALETAKSMLALAESEENDYLAGWAGFYAGRALYWADQEEDSLTYLSSARSHFRTCGDLQLVSKVDDFTATVHDYLGNYETSANLLTACLHIANTTPGDDDDPYANRRLGNALSSLGRHEEALTYLGTAREAYRSQNNLKFVAYVDREIADELSSLNRNEEALEVFVRAQSLFDAIGDDSNVRYCKINRSQIYHALGDMVQAERLASQVLIEVQGDPSFDDQKYIYWVQLHIADDLFEMGKYDKVIELTHEMDDVKGQPDTWAKIERRTIRARALFELNMHSEALAEVEATLSMLVETERNSSNAYLYEIRGRILLDQGNKSGERDFTHAIAIHLRAGRSEVAKELAEYFIPELPKGRDETIGAPNQDEEDKPAFIDETQG
jgi:tetratricopeptide (TPR) repeat protein